jgi:hypothetical protein
MSVCTTEVMLGSRRRYFDGLLALSMETTQQAVTKGPRNIALGISITLIAPTTALMLAKAI